MGSLVSSAAALLLTSLLALLYGSSLGQDLQETDALCDADGCFVIYFQRKIFLDSWRFCKEKGGNLATVKRREDANRIKSLFSTVDLRHSRTKVQVWIGLQRQPRQCTSVRPLRGFSWTTGDQDTDYTNWQKEDSPSLCSVPRCVVMGFNTQDPTDNFKWLDGSCSVPVDGYLCHFTYKGMCPALWSEGAGNALYGTPFGLLSTLLTHIPIGSVATVPCPTGTKEEQTVLCILKDDGSAKWSRDSPLCSDPLPQHDWCNEDNGGCEHFCRPAGGHFFCECANGYRLADDGQSCDPIDVCEGAPCEFECLPLSDVYRCACPEGYMLNSDEQSCLDVDECLQSPCEHKCVNTPGGFECQCHEGYQVDEDDSCEDIDECIQDPCEHACENTLGSHICHCHLGHSPLPEDPSRCQDIDECQMLGICEQMCVNYEGGFECFCEVGYVLMWDNSSCQKMDDQATVTPAFPTVTRPPGFIWDQGDYTWMQTDWPPEEEPTADWLTDPPKYLDSDVHWINRSPQNRVPTAQPPRMETGKGKEEERDDQRLDVHADSPTTFQPATTSKTPTDWYKEEEKFQDDGEEEEETTTAAPFLSTSTISEGAWNWWSFTTSRQRAAEPKDTVIDQSIFPDAANHSQPDEAEQPPGRDRVTPEEQSKTDTDYHDPIVITLPTLSQLTTGRESNTIDSVLRDKDVNQGSTWLLVGLLVPLCIFIVVMVALGIIFCSRCPVQPRNKSTTDCYHWISGAHDKQGAVNPSGAAKSPV